MKTSCRLFISLVASACIGAGATEEPVKPEKMSERELLARARQLVQEELELSKLATTKSGSDKVKQFAGRAAEQDEESDKKLTELAAEEGVTAAEKISKPMLERLAAIGKLQGQTFDPDYLKMLLDLYGENILILEEIAKRTNHPKLREYAREALTQKRAQRKEVQKLAAPEIPEVNGNRK
jgi:predicted outer membrane protein